MLLVAVNLRTMFLMYFAKASHNSNNRDVLFDLFEQSKKKPHPLNPLIQLYSRNNSCQNGLSEKEINNSSAPIGMEYGVIGGGLAR